ncbi:MAG: UDP-N-acetylmuramoyl-L-alanine--D-glutamate ligase [Clostridiales bacterium]|nr:UDP-N-acetylmuramoyl-L-alanine--D-glutamate ligase [Clostridiales bacterium]
MYIKTQKFLVLGISKSGYAVAKYILSNGGKCYLFEELSTPKIQTAINELLELGGIRVDQKDVDQIIKQIDVLVISPGVPINHPVAVKVKNLNKRIVGELEFGVLQFAPPIVAITGTNGKTTTATLVESIFNRAGAKALLVGNIGIPISGRIDDADKNTVCIAEVSSFQLESVSSFCPHISCVLNIAPDHLERHYSMENYIYLKKRIFKNQRESEFLILNYDDETVKEFSQESKAKSIYVSLKEKVYGGYRIDKKLYFFDEYIMDEEQLALKGEHNVFNALFAISIAKLMDVNNDIIIDALKNFKGVRHRMEIVAKKEGVTFYNDSKATNTASTIVAIENMKEPTILILGGSEKGEEYIKLFQKIKISSVKHAILTGASRLNMLDCAGKVGYSNITVTPDFETAVRIAKIISREGDNVLLSPACASFDCFNGYEERGDKFKSIVEGF